MKKSTRLNLFFVWALLSFISADILLTKVIYLFFLLLQIIHVAVLRLKDFSYLLLILFLSCFLQQISLFFNCEFVRLILASRQFVIFYNAVTLTLESFNPVFLIVYKTVQINKHSSGIIWLLSFFNFPKYYIVEFLLDQHLILSVHLN